jgi:hypothetical protein
MYRTNFLTGGGNDKAALSSRRDSRAWAEKVSSASGPRDTNRELAESNNNRKKATVYFRN